LRRAPDSAALDRVYDPDRRSVQSRRFGPESAKLGPVFIQTAVLTL
jgi:hypothetical protein